MKPFLIVMCMVVICSASIVRAENKRSFVRNHQLYSACSHVIKKTDKVAEKSFCYGFISAAVEYNDALSKEPKNANRLCLPDYETTLGTFVQTYYNWAKENPIYLSETASRAILRALIAAYPCLPPTK